MQKAEFTIQSSLSRVIGISFFQGLAIFFLCCPTALLCKSHLRKTKSIEEAGGINVLKSVCFLNDFQEGVRVQNNWNNISTLKTCIHLNSLPVVNTYDIHQSKETTFFSQDL